MSFEVQTFGGFSFRDCKIRKFPNLGTTATELFAYLILNNSKECYRETLSEKFWGNETNQQSQSAFNTTLWRLRKRLNQDDLLGMFHIESSADSVHLNINGSQIIFDFIELRNAVLEMESEAKAHFAKNIPNSTLQQWSKNLDRYYGELLPNIDSHWVLIERERYRCLYIRGCEYLMRAFAAHGRFERAISFGRKILIQDDLRENTHRQIMWLYVMNGQRHRALNQYLLITRNLEEQLGVQPMRETQNLNHYILNMTHGLNGVPQQNVSTTPLEFVESFKCEMSKQSEIFQSLCMVE